MNRTVEKAASLKIYYSKEDLTTRIDDYFNIIVLPAICMFGMITNSLSLVVLIRLTLNSFINLYMMVNSIAKLAYLTIKFFKFVFQCGALCPYGYTHSSKVYEMYVNSYLGHCLIFIVALNDIFFSIDRLLAFQAKKKTYSMIAHTIHLNLLRTLLIVLFSLVFILPNQILSQEVRAIGVLVTPGSNGSEVLFGVKQLKEWDQPHLKAFLLFNSISRRAIVFCVLLVVNLFILKKLKTHLKVKNELVTKGPISQSSQPIAPQSSSTKTNRVTKMVLAICNLYLLGNVLDLVNSIFNKTLFESNQLRIASDIFIYGSHTLAIFIYYYFDRSFQSEFKVLFLRRRDRSNSSC